MQFKNLWRIGQAFYTHLRDVYKAVLFDTDIHKCTEGSYIGNDSMQLHSDLKVFDFPDIMSEFKFLYSSSITNYNHHAIY